MHRLRDQGADGKTWIERGIGVLKHHLHPAANLAQFFPLHLCQVLVVKKNLPCCGFIETGNRTSDGGFTRSAFAHQAQRLSTLDSKINAIHRTHIAYYALQNDASCQRKVHLEIAYIY